MRILIVKTSSLGDVVHMLPAITDAARAIPNLTVDWVVEENFQAVPSWHPNVNQIFPVAIRRWRKCLLSPTTFKEIKNSRNQIRAIEYDAIIDSQGLFKSSILTHWANGPRFGYDKNSAREPMSRWAYDQHLNVSRELHAIERNRQITSKALGYSSAELALSYGLDNLIERLPATLELKLPENYVIGLHGTSRPDKEWAEKNWTELSTWLDQQATPLILPWGNQREHDRAHRIAENSNAVVLPKLDLNSLAQIISGASAVVGMDTGLMHIAAALAKPGVAIYPVTQPALTGVCSETQAPAITNFEGLVSSEMVIEQLKVYS